MPLLDLPIEKTSAFITAVTSIVALLISTFTLIKQTEQSRLTLAVNILRDLEKNFFFSHDTRGRRCVAAKFLLERPNGETPPPEAYELLDFFDTLALHVNKGIIDAELAWITFYWWFDKYWALLKDDVEALHEENDGVKYLENCAKLHVMLTQFGVRYKNLPPSQVRHSPDKIRTFLLDEIKSCEKNFSC